MSDPTYPLFPVCSFLGCVLVIIPLPWHLEAWNSGTCYFMIWTSLACLNQFVNSVAWANTAVNMAPVWCDISTKFTIGASVGIPASSMCITRRLYSIARLRSTTISRVEKRRAIFIDSLICVFFPCVCMALSYVVQGHRFNIYEEIGCNASLYNTLLTYFLVYWWPVLIGLVSATYSILALRAFAIRRTQFSQFLSSNKSSLTFGRYFRLMALAATEMMLTVPISSYIIYLNATSGPLQPWVSWAYVHYDFSRVVEVPAVLWQLEPEAVIALRLGQWLNPMCACIFFAYFGFASEARRNYAKAFWFLAEKVGLAKWRRNNTPVFHDTFKLKPPRSPGSDDTETLPAYSPSGKLGGACFSASSMFILDKKIAPRDLSVTSYTVEDDNESPSTSPVSSSRISPFDSTFISSCSPTVAFTDLESSAPLPGVSPAEFSYPTFSSPTRV